MVEGGFGAVSNLTVRSNEMVAQVQRSPIG